MKKSIAFTALLSLPIFYSSNTIAKQQVGGFTTTSCSFTGEVYNCSTTFHRVSGGYSEPPRFDYYYYTQYQARVTNTHYPSQLDSVLSQDLRNNIKEGTEIAYDKTPLTSEEKQNFIDSINTTRNFIQNLIEEATEYGLATDEMLDKLTKSVNALDYLKGQVLTTSQVTNELINGDWAEASNTIRLALGSMLVMESLNIIYLGGRSAISMIPQVRGLILVSAASATVYETVDEYYDVEGKLDEAFNYLQKLFDLSDSETYGSGYSGPNNDPWDEIPCSSLPTYKQEQIGCIPPLILDINEDGFTFSSMGDTKAVFDINGDNIPDRMSLPTGDNAIVFADWNGSGVLDNVKEFDFSRFSEEGGTDLDGLIHFDGNRDKRIDNKDNVYSHLYMWIDYNHNQISEPHEVKSLSEEGIVLDYTEMQYQLNEKGYKGNRLDQSFHFIQDGESKPAGSFSLKYTIEK